MPARARIFRRSCMLPSRSVKSGDRSIIHPLSRRRGLRLRCSNRGRAGIGELCSNHRRHYLRGAVMNPFPEDIFTEPENVDPDTLANLGPLRRLAGVWQSSKGVDVAPKAPGPERREYIERIAMQPTDPQANGPQ